MLIISDSNIFIDMEVSGLTRQLFQLPESFGTPNILFEEELMAQHPELPVLGLSILEVRAEFIVLADQWQDKYPDPTMNDLFAMALAIQEQSPLLTGDQRLRRAAEKEKIEVYGTLWLMDRMHHEEIITIKTMKKAYELMRDVKRRLPWDEVDKQLKRFSKK